VRQQPIASLEHLAPVRHFGHVLVFDRFGAGSRVNPLRSILASIMLALSASVLAAEAPQACSGSGFLSSDYSWLGIPVMHNASQPAGDDVRCLYVVPVSVALVEQWHLKKLAEEGWQAIRRESTERGVELDFQRIDRVVRIVIDDIQFATAVLVKRPVMTVADTTVSSP
jgi:hypothetical protein